MKTLLIDDFRDIKTDAVARTFEGGIYELENNGPWDVLYLDHDLGCYDKGGRELTGYDIVCWLEWHPRHRPNKVVLVSSNPAGVNRMGLALSNLYNTVSPDCREYSNPKAGKL
jgi:hypothetical protein